MDIKIPILRSAVGSRIFGATFTKANGKVRTGTFRLGVKKNLTGTGLAYRPSERGNLIVWDMSLGQYRTIKMSRLSEVRVYGQSFDFTEG
jgi:hypothetical protein